MIAQIGRVLKHADHQPGLICRPAGIGLCEPLPGTHLRPDGKTCGYLAERFCNKCGAFLAREDEDPR